MQQSEFEKRFCAGLSEQQLRAVRTVDGPVLLLAVPGSGKTTVLVKRLGFMIFCGGIAPESILTMTFSNAAAKEMKERFREAFEFPGMERMTFCTIHSLCNRIIRYVGSLKGRKPFSLLEESAGKGLIRRIYLQQNQEYPPDSTVQDVQNHITRIKNMGLSDEQLEEKEFDIDHMKEIYRAYNRELRQRRQMDFDDQLVYAHHILASYPAVLQHFRDQFPYLCVDEAQDTSSLQHRIIGLLSGTAGNLFMVGDEDQSIYGFRGADPSGLLSFEKRYQNALVLTMEQNFRSREPIAAASNHLIHKNLFRYDKKICPTRSGGSPVEVIGLLHRADQYTAILERVRTAEEETAVLYRNNDSALPLIDLLERAAIPYNYTGREMGFFTHRIVTDFLDIIAFSKNPRNQELFGRIYYKIGLRINRDTAENACRESSCRGKNILDILRGFTGLSAPCKRAASNAAAVLEKFSDQTASQVLDAIWVSLDYQSYVHQKQSDPGKYPILQMLAAREPDLEDFLVRLKVLEQTVSGHRNLPGTVLTLSTIHASKGLEYDHVYLLDVIDGILPQESEKNNADLLQHEEDRRICYVGMTRARESLHLFSCRDSNAEFVSAVQEGKLLRNARTRKPEASEAEPAPRPWVTEFIQLDPGQKVYHRFLGPGVILSVTGDYVRIQLDQSHSMRTFSLRALIKERMLELRD